MVKLRSMNEKFSSIFATFIEKPSNIDTYEKGKLSLGKYWKSIFAH